MDEDVFLVDDDEDDLSPPPTSSRARANSMGSVIIDLTAEDSDIEERNPLDLSSDDDLPYVNINGTIHSANGNGTAAASSYNSNFTDYKPSTSYTRDATPPKNGSDSEVSTHDNGWPPSKDTDSENEDIGWPPATNGDSNVNDETEDVGWPPARESGSENEELPASQQSLVQYHPLSDSEQSETEPPAAKKATKKNPAPSSGNKQTECSSKAKKTSPAKKNKRRTPQEIAEEATRKAAVKREKEALRRLRPEHCQKYIVVEVDTTVPQIPALNAVLLCPPLSQLKNEVCDRDVPYSVTWFRQVLNEGTESKEYSDVMLQVLPMEVVENFVASGSLCEHVANLHNVSTKICKVAFIVFESSLYFKNNKKKRKGQITREQLEEAIAECQVERASTFRLVDTAQEVAEWIYRYSKSFAEHPFKSSKKGWQDNFRFHLSVEKGDSLRLGSAINEGMPQMWVRILRKLRRATAEACEAIVTKYPTPTALIIAYEECESEEEARYLLQNVEMKRGVGPMAVSRRIGPVLSRKIHTLLTSTQPTALLADTQ